MALAEASLTTNRITLKAYRWAVNGEGRKLQKALNCRWHSIPSWKSCRLRLPTPNCGALYERHFRTGFRKRPVWEPLTLQICSGVPVATISPPGFSAFGVPDR